jgi:predicted nucleotidyltransferase
MLAPHPDYDGVKARLAPLLARPGLRLAVLFGSTAAGRARVSSDVDIGVLYDGDPEALRQEAVRLLGTDRIDLVDLRRASPLLAMAVAKTGRVLHEGETAAFASFASLRRFNDTAKLRQARERGIRAFLAERGL